VATHRFARLLADLGTIERTTCRERISGATFPLRTTPSDAQRHALDLRPWRARREVSREGTGGTLG
jgi:hypothetical protein